jgi:hypothetical protein
LLVEQQLYLWYIYLGTIKHHRGNKTASDRQTPGEDKNFSSSFSSYYYACKISNRTDLQSTNSFAECISVPEEKFSIKKIMNNYKESYHVGTIELCMIYRIFTACYTVYYTVKCPRKSPIWSNEWSSPLSYCRNEKKNKNEFYWKKSRD